MQGENRETSKIREKGEKDKMLGLGKGEKQKLLWLSPEEIIPNPSQPRKYFPPEEMEALVQSIQKNGLLQPITVRRNGSRWELVAGERRWRASQKVGLEKIPCFLFSCTDQESAVLAMTENLQRQDLNPFEEAEGIARILAQWNVTQEEAAQRLGKSQSYVANKLRLLRFTPEERSFLLENGLTERHARVLLRLDTREKRKEAMETFLQQDMTVAQAEEYVLALLQEETEQAEENQQDLFRDREAELRPEKPRKTVLIRDVRIFFNTIRHAVTTMRSSGIPAESQQEETENYIEYRIRIPKTQGKIQKLPEIVRKPPEGREEREGREGRESSRKKESSRNLPGQAGFAETSPEPSSMYSPASPQKAIS